MSATTTPQASVTAPKSDDRCIKILSAYLLSLVSQLSDQTLEYVKAITKTDRTEYLTPRMYHSSLMEKYLKHFRDRLNDVEFVEELLKKNNPKMPQSMENIYQWSVYDVYDTIEEHTSREAKNNDKRIDIQIEYFRTFVQMFLREIYQQMTTSKAFYFHRLTHQEQRQRIDALLEPLLAKCVHPSAGIRSTAGIRTVPKQVEAVTEGASRVVHIPASVQKRKDVDEKDGKEDEDDGDEGLDEDDIMSTQEVQSSTQELRSSASTIASSVLSTKAVYSQKQQRPVKGAAAVPSSAVVLPEPIRSAKPVPTIASVKPKIASVKPAPAPVASVKPKAVTETTAIPVQPAAVASTAKHPLENLVISVAPKPPSTKMVATPMKLQSEAIRSAQRQNQSATKQAKERLIRSSKIVTNPGPVVVPSSFKSVKQLPSEPTKPSKPIEATPVVVAS